MKNRIYLSPPHIGSDEEVFLKEAFKSNYIAPIGPQVDLFEKEFVEYTGIKNCVALSSGTAAMHMAIKGLGIGSGDEVFASTLTFVGSVSPTTFLGAIPVFIDCDRNTWNMDVGLLEEALENSNKQGKLPKAVVPTDLYGQCCDLPRIVEICDRYGVTVICDSAEAMGARYKRIDGRGQKTDGREQNKQKSQSSGLSPQRSPQSGVSQSSVLSTQSSPTWIHAGCGAKAAIYSFNGNKILTTSGGGMLASNDKDLVEYARYLSQQARDDFPHYEHSEIGYNYRMSNVLAAIGRGQLKVLDDRARRKREIFNYYYEALQDTPGIEFMPEAPYCRSNHWLTVILITPEIFGVDREQVRLELEAENIESRPVWKPMHMQPVFKIEGNNQISPPKKPQYPARAVGGSVSEDLFNRGLCLPSGTALENSDLDRIIETILKCR